MNTALRFSLLASGVAILAGCSNSHPGVSFAVDPNYHPIMSTRPQTATDTVAIVKLTEPPLLATLKIVDGKKTVDPARAEAVKAEQDAIIAKMQAISPKIQVLYRYRLVANGLAIVAPLETLPALRALGNVAYVEVQTSFTRPVLAETSAPGATLLERTSVKFIGATDAQARGIRGQGMKVGVLDTGIDYTHSMFGGAGTADAYKAIDPSKETTSFPTAKVVGGIDLVGTEYNSASADYSKRTPKVDSNPLDEGGHGSHVAGTVAGLGDGAKSYDGVAPDALLYAIKVFGADGSTGDAVVVAGLEYSADPNADLNLDDKLDVVNLSLGSSFGSPHILYTEAMGHLSRGGTVVVASAGNSGDNDYIVGA
ncbi:MAG: S8 family serine peptidase, partial [Bdellovibrionota bacterium]